MAELAREVICLFGLPFDVVTMGQTVRLVREAVGSRQPLFLSTPNLNFLIGCQHDAAFRQSVLDSDLSVADGMPLIWMARWLGAPLPERVTGSGLFERLRDEPPPPGQAAIKVYFFGGPPGAAEAASLSLNAGALGMVCVGFETPGFGSVADMSTPDVLARINASGADFLVVALGAVKGQAWIQRNRAQLLVPVISHLGAVVNFAAGTVNRAPVWVQKSGLEWLWRIKEEPTLWRRYWGDAKALVSLMLGQLLPHARWLRRQPIPAPATLSLLPDGQNHRLSLQGAVFDPLPVAMLITLQQAATVTTPLLLDLTQATGFGPGFAGQLLRLAQAMRLQNKPLQITRLPPLMKRLFGWNGLTDLILLSEEYQTPNASEANASKK